MAEDKGDRKYKALEDGRKIEIQEEYNRKFKYSTSVIAQVIVLFMLVDVPHTIGT